METIQTVFQLALYGVRDCLYGVSSLKYFWSLSQKENKHPPSSSQKRTTKLDTRPKTIFDILRQCLVFGAIFWLATYLFHTFIVGYCFRHINSFFLTPEEEESLSWLQGFLDFIFTVIWILPLFIASRLLNYYWYQRLADATCDTTGVKKKNTLSFSYSIGDQIASCVSQVLFLIQGYILFLFPVPSYLQNFVAIFHLSLLYALYAFEYKWVVKGWQLDRRINFVESKWPYFVGFGFILACLTSYSGSYLESLCLFSTFFPFYVISSTVTCDRQLQTYNRPFRVFRFVTSISDFVIYLVCSLVELIFK